MPEENAATWLIVPVVAPLIAALVSFVAGNRLIKWLGTATSAAVVIASTVITWQVWHHGPQTYLMGDWTVPLGIQLYADGLTCIMLLMSSVVGVFISIYSIGYFAETASFDQPFSIPKSTMFWPLWMAMFSALNGLFLSGDIFNLYVTLELLTLAAVGLIVLADERPATDAAMRYLMVALAGSMFYFTGVAMIYGLYGVLDIGTLATVATTDDSLRAALLLIMVGLMLKTALFPFHFWLPPAHACAPAPVSAVLSGLVVKGSFYISIRLWFDFFPAELTQPLAMLPAMLGAFAIIWGSFQALLAERFKQLIAYSTVAQIGYLFLVFALANPDSEIGFKAWAGCLLFAVSHGFAKASMFLSAGIILRTAGHDRISELSSVAYRMPITFFSIAIASVSLMGLPPTAAFAGKWMMLSVAFAEGHYVFASVIVIGGVLAAGYLFRVLSAAFAHPDEISQPENVQEQCEVATSMRPSTRLLENTALGLALSGLLVGVVSQPIIAMLEVGSPWSNGRTSMDSNSDFLASEVLAVPGLCSKRGLTLSGEAGNAWEIVLPPKGQPPFQTEPSKEAG